MNRHDWLKIAGLLGLGATGAGLAGVGPLAALGVGAKGATLAAGLAGPTTQGAGGLMGAGALLGQAAPVAGAAGKAMTAANAASGLMTPPPQPAPPPPPRPQPPQGPTFGGYGQDNPELAALAAKYGMSVEQLKQLLSRGQA